MENYFKSFLLILLFSVITSCNESLNNTSGKAQKFSSTKYNDFMGFTIGEPVNKSFNNKFIDKCDEVKLGACYPAKVYKCTTKHKVADKIWLWAYKENLYKLEVHFKEGYNTNWSVKGYKGLVGKFGKPQATFQYNGQTNDKRVYSTCYRNGCTYNHYEDKNSPYLGKAVFIPLVMKDPYGLVYFDLLDENIAISVKRSIASCKSTKNKKVSEGLGF